MWKPRTRMERTLDGGYRLTVDHVQTTLTRQDFEHHAQEVLNVLQSIRAEMLKAKDGTP